MSELKNGDLVLVSDSGRANDWLERRFIGKQSDGRFVCEGGFVCQGPFPWHHCKPLPEKKIRPFKDVFEVPVNAWFRLKNTDSISKIIGTSAGGGVFFYAQQNADNFQDLLENHEMSLDGKEWTPAGVEE
jgi:hypothetical protein